MPSCCCCCCCCCCYYHGCLATSSLAIAWAQRSFAWLSRGRGCLQVRWSSDGCGLAAIGWRQQIDRPARLQAMCRLHTTVLLQYTHGTASRQRRRHVSRRNQENCLCAGDLFFSWQRTLGAKAESIAMPPGMDGHTGQHHGAGASASASAVQCSAVQEAKVQPV